MIKPEQQNTHLTELTMDTLYHLGLDTAMDLKGIFGDTKYVCMSGSAERVEDFAHQCNTELGLGIADADIVPIGKTERYSLYKIGPIIAVSHGMGMPSIQILLHELTKALMYAGCEQVAYIRIGTSGGIDLAPGTVAITTQSINGKLQAEFVQDVLGHTRTWPTEFDPELAQQLYDARENLPAAMGKTLSTNDFYEEEGHLDGALAPGYTKEDVHTFTETLRDMGVINIEMESLAFAAFCLRAGIPAGMVSATLTDRFQGDQIDFSKQELMTFSRNAQQLVINFLRTKIV
jgi:uridine phosphorylase